MMSKDMNKIWQGWEEEILRIGWELDTKEKILEKLPMRSWSAISQHARKMGLPRIRFHQKSKYKKIGDNWFSWQHRPDGYIHICGKVIGPPTYRMYEHRYVWGLHNGPIDDDCEIHHIDGDRTNNRIENLECLHRSQHHSRDREVRRSMTKFLKDKGLYNEWLEKQTRR